MYLIILEDGSVYKSDNPHYSLFDEADDGFQLLIWKPDLNIMKENGL